MHDRPGPSPETSRHVSEGLFAFFSEQLPQTVVGYLSMADEVEITDLFQRLPGWRWVLPRVEDDGSLTLRDRDVGLERHRWGMYQPVNRGPTVPPIQVDTVLVPGLAFDRLGTRLGRGAGYYDRLLAECRSDCTTIGITWSERILDRIPRQAHDVQVAYLATEDGVSRCPTS